MTSKTFICTTVAVATALVAGVSSAAVKDGTFEGTGMGRGGPIQVAVTFEKGRIADVKIVKQTETLGVSDPALTSVPVSVVKGNSVNVDAVTGATMTRKGILQAVGAAIVAAGGKVTDFNKPAAKAPTPQGVEKVSTDVIVIGGGAGGMAAAVRAAQQGAKVILIEKRPNIGGATQLNAGTLIATGSRYQREVMKETKDSPALAYKDIMRVGEYKNDPVLVKMVTEKAGGVVDWLIDDLKIPYGPAATQYPDHSANRQLGVQGRSVNWLKLMNRHLTEFGGKVMTNTRAQEFITDKNGNVVGVKATMQNGQKINFSAKSVVLAAGGYGANRSMLPKPVSTYLFYGLDTETGDGLAMGKKIGADTINLDLVKQYPQGVETIPHHGLAATASSTDTMKKSGAIYVNRDGKRIVNELADLGTLTKVTEAQKDAIMYIVMDKAAWKQYVAKSLEDKLVAAPSDLNKWTQIVNNGYPVMATSAKVTDAAQKMGIDPKALSQTIADWNKMVANGKDTAFDRKVLMPLSDGPYYIVEQKPRFQTTLGGLKANADMQILRKNGKPIGNLYGAGCVVGGANGADSMTAMMNSWAIISGAVAGDSAVKNLKH